MFQSLQIAASEFFLKAFVLAKKYKDTNCRCEEIYNNIKSIL